MKRYELKDKERQAALEKMLPGFSEDLQKACEDDFDDGFNHVCVQLSAGSDVFYYGTVDIRKAAICTKEVYDPHAWNNYPEVTPPEGVWMRCEGHDHSTAVWLRAALVFDGKRWKEPRGDTYWLGTVERFRPWDDEGKDE